MDNKKELAAELQRRLEKDYLNDNYLLTKVIAFCMGYKAAMKEVKSLTDKSL